MYRSFGQERLILRVPFVGFLALATQRKMLLHPPTAARGLRLVA